MSTAPITDLPAFPAEPTLEDAPFWEAAAEGRLVLPRCRSCGTVIWYPRPFCPECRTTSGVEWISASGRGTVYSFTVSHRGMGPYSQHAPYVVAYVELEEGPRVLTNIVGADLDALRIGDAVEVVFQPAGDTKVPRFRPA